MVPVHLILPLLAAALHVEESGLRADLGVTRHSGGSTLRVFHIGEVFEEARCFAIDFVQSSIVVVVHLVALLRLLSFLKICASYFSGVSLLHRGSIEFFASARRCAWLFSRLRVSA